ncbi:MAG: hypothetical protein R3E50_02655 [Halioglobus sp.]
MARLPWGDASVVLSVIDEVVAARMPDGELRYFRAGKMVAAPGVAGDALAQAIVRRMIWPYAALRVPAAAEAELDSVLSLEVTSSSPFQGLIPVTDGRFPERSADVVVVQLVISSKSAAMSYVASQRITTMSGPVKSGPRSGRMVLVSGFGEVPRRRRNHSRLVRMAGMLACCLLVIMLMFALGAGSKYLELQKVREIEARVEQASSEAVKLRASLSSSKSMIATINELLKAYPSPHYELKRLSSLLGDDTWLGVAEIQGSAIKIEGESSDASAVMQQLLDYPAYTRVEAPVAIRKSGPGSEHFVFKLTLVDGTGGQ